MVTFNVEKYKVFEFAGKGKPVRVYMDDNAGKYRGYVDFL